MRRAIAVISVLTFGLLLFGVASAQAQTRSLDVYVIDVEGGNATLFVSQPYRESLLIDTGNAGAAAPRDPTVEPSSRTLLHAGVPAARHVPKN